MTSNIFAVACPVCFSERIIPLNKWYSDCFKCYATVLAAQIPGHKYIRTSCGSCTVWSRVPEEEIRTECTCGKIFTSNPHRERLNWCGQDIHFAGIGTPFTAESELCMPLLPERIQGTDEHSTKKLQMEQQRLQIKQRDLTMQVEKLEEEPRNRFTEERRTLEKRLEETTRVLETRDRELKQMKANHEREICFLAKQRIDMVVEADKKKDEMEAVGQAFMDVVTSLEEANKEISHLKEENQMREAELGNAKESLQGFKDLLEYSRKQADDYQQELIEMTMKSYSQEKTLAEKEKELAKLAAEKEEWSSQSRKESMEEQHWAKTIEDLMDQLQEKERMIRRLRETTQSLSIPNDVVVLVSTASSSQDGQKDEALEITKKQLAEVCVEGEKMKAERDQLKQENEQLWKMNAMAVLKIKELSGQGNSTEEKNNSAKEGE